MKGTRLIYDSSNQKIIIWAEINTILLLSLLDYSVAHIPLHFKIKRSPSVIPNERSYHTQLTYSESEEVATFVSYPGDSYTGYYLLSCIKLATNQMNSLSTLSGGKRFLIF